MRLTLHTDFALRILMSLAVAGERLVTIEELARRHRLPKNHLMKIARSLTGIGVVDGVRGRSGGLRLARPAAQIRIGRVVRDLEPLALVACQGSKPEGCVLVGACGLTAALDRAMEAFFAELDGVTLRDVVAERRGLRERLGLDTPEPAQPLA
ncbi:Rrf2 family transcriptional regulator [Prosthecomicrobium sp. N25]|uniref:Rrf2 family transcriptional regulator n=1 Tax=Prosthecomicrobium sp. N25 TaxID=3129254 RepID=UPI0030779B67